MVLLCAALVVRDAVLAHLVGGVVASCRAGCGCSRGSEVAIAVRATVIIGPSALAPMPFLRCSGGVTSAMNTVFQTAPDCRAARRHIENRVGKFFVEDARLDLGGELRARQLVDELGASLDGRGSELERSVAGDARCPMAANRMTGAITFRLETPAARIAMISPSLAMRPRPIRMPTSTPNGMVSGQHGRERQREQRHDGLGPGVACAHQHLEQLVGLLQEDDERRQQRPEQRAGQDLPENVTAEQAEHGSPTRGQCRRPARPAAWAAHPRADAAPGRRSGSKARSPPPRW